MWLLHRWADTQLRARLVRALAGRSVAEDAARHLRFQLDASRTANRLMARDLATARYALAEMTKERNQ